VKTAAALAAIVLIVGSLQLARPGYSVDEEFTVFAVRGIQAHGLPVLPSGLLYDRGIAYSYAAWFAGAITGSELPAFRAVSLIAAVVSVFRPAMIIGSQHTPWLLEKTLPLFSFVTPAKFKSIRVEQIAKAMIAAAKKHPAASATYHYPEMMALIASRQR